MNTHARTALTTLAYAILYGTVIAILLWVLHNDQEPIDPYTAAFIGGMFGYLHNAGFWEATYALLKQLTGQTAQPEGRVCGDPYNGARFPHAPVVMRPVSSADIRARPDTINPSSLMRVGKWAIRCDTCGHYLIVDEDDPSLA